MPEAHEQFLLGKEFARRGGNENLRRAIDAFNRAVALDPEFGPPWAYIGYLNFQATLETARTSAEVEAAARKALEYSEKAIRLAPDDSACYLRRGKIRSYLMDWVRTYALNVLAPAGQLDEALTLDRKATELDPLVPSIGLTQLLAAQGRLDEALAAARRTMQIAPEDDSLAVVTAEVLLLLKRPAEALSVVRPVSDGYWKLTGLALAYHDLGEASASQRALDALIRDFSSGAAYQVAEVYAWRGENDHAFEWLDRALEQHDPGMVWLPFDQMFVKIRTDARYPRLLARMKLAPIPAPK